MFLNIFPLTLIYIFFFTIILSAGKLTNDYILRFKNLSLGEYGLIGFLFFYFLSLTFHFFIPINDYLIYFFYLILLIFFFKNILCQWPNVTHFPRVLRDNIEHEQMDIILAVVSVITRENQIVFKKSLNAKPTSSFFKYTQVTESDGLNCLDILGNFTKHVLVQSGFNEILPTFADLFALWN